MSVSIVNARVRDNDVFAPLLHTRITTRVIPDDDLLDGVGPIGKIDTEILTIKSFSSSWSRQL